MGCPHCFTTSWASGTSWEKNMREWGFCPWQNAVFHSLSATAGANLPQEATVGSQDWNDWEEGQEVPAWITAWCILGVDWLCLKEHGKRLGPKWRRGHENSLRRNYISVRRCQDLTCLFFLGMTLISRTVKIASPGFICVCKFKYSTTSKGYAKPA